MRRLYISFKSLVNDFVYSFGRAALLLLVEVYNHTVPVRERRRISVKGTSIFPTLGRSVSSVRTLRANDGLKVKLGKKITVINRDSSDAKLPKVSMTNVAVSARAA